MNKECLQICNFGPIVKADINNIGDVNVFIGEPGSGKSTVMKTLALCKKQSTVYASIRCVKAGELKILNLKL